MNTPIYYYVFNSNYYNYILKTKTITPLTYEGYEDYFKPIYDKKFKDVLSTPFTNCGIYLTLFDFQPIKPSISTKRFTFTINDLDLSKTVINMGDDVRLLTHENIKENYIRPLQIVTFVDHLKIND